MASILSLDTDVAEGDGRGCRCDCHVVHGITLPACLAACRPACTAPPQSNPAIASPIHVILFMVVSISRKTGCPRNDRSCRFMACLYLFNQAIVNP